MITQAVVLCGGLGTRLGSLTATTPKPLLPVAGTPFLARLLFEIRRHGISRVTFLAAYRSAAVEDFVAQWCPRLKLTGTMVVEPERAGTGGALWHARDALDAAFLLFNGDSWFDVNILALAAALDHDPAAMAVLALRRVEDAARYGTVALENGRVTRFSEKAGVPTPGLVNGGAYAVRRTLLDRLSPVSSLEQDGLAALAPEGRLIGHVHDGFFLDIGVPDDFDRAHRLVPAAQRRGAVFLEAARVAVPDAAGRPMLQPDVARDIRTLNDAGLFVMLLDAPDQPTDAAALAATLAPHGAHVDAVAQGDRGALAALCRDWPVDIGTSMILGEPTLAASMGDAVRRLDPATSLRSLAREIAASRHETHP